ncbi:MAG TPA: DUF58 domain-containing protein [Rhodanobacteraceae bacterium]|nr:DUF58 domain-containing protein [Rhodanobacteraceae bacterium]
MTFSASRWFAPLLARAERRLPALTRLKPAEALPITLDRKRIYILPTAYGLGFAVILLVMLLGALNYGNNAALLLTCLLAAVAVNSMLATFRALDRLQLTALQAGPAEAGRDITVELYFHGGGRPHPALRIEGWGAPHFLDVAASGESPLSLHLPTRQRGWMDLPRLRIASTWPFGWFRAWSWLAPAPRVLVYPRAERSGPAVPVRDGGRDQRHRAGGDEWSSLREYRSGDPLRLVAWRASARSEELRVKTFEQAHAEHSTRLEWAATASLAYEDRIARLARWVAESHRRGADWSLQLPERTLPMASGDHHYHQCLRALAELP